MNQSKSTSLAAQSDYVLTYLGQFGNHGLTLTAGLTTNYNESSSLSGGRSQLAGYGILVGDDPDRVVALYHRRMYLRQLMAVLRVTDLPCLICSEHCITTRIVIYLMLLSVGTVHLFSIKTGNTWDNFYSFGAGWVMTEEKFMQNPECN